MMTLNPVKLTITFFLNCYMNKAIYRRKCFLDFPQSREAQAQAAGMVLPPRKEKTWSTNWRHPPRSHPHPKPPQRLTLTRNQVFKYSQRGTFSVNLPQLLLLVRGDQCLVGPHKPQVGNSQLPLATVLGPEGLHGAPMSHIWLSHT